MFWKKTGVKILLLYIFFSCSQNKRIPKINQCICRIGLKFLYPKIDFFFIIPWWQNLIFFIFEPNTIHIANNKIIIQNIFFPIKFHFWFEKEYALIRFYSVWMNHFKMLENINKMVLTASFVKVFFRFLTKNKINRPYEMEPWNTLSTSKRFFLSDLKWFYSIILLKDLFWVENIIYICKK